MHLGPLLCSLAGLKLGGLESTDDVKHLFGQRILGGLPRLFNVDKPQTSAVCGVKFDPSELDKPGIAIKRPALDAIGGAVEWSRVITPRQKRYGLRPCSANIAFYRDTRRIDENLDRSIPGGLG